MEEKLTEDERNDALSFLVGWTLVEGRDAITKSYKFADFVVAFGFMTQIALIAESMNHHPEWSNVYSQVTVTLSTHDVGGLSALDVKLANKMDAVASALLVLEET